MTAELHLELKEDKILKMIDCISFIFNKCTGEDWAWIPRLGAVLNLDNFHSTCLWKGRWAPTGLPANSWVKWNTHGFWFIYLFIFFLKLVPPLAFGLGGEIMVLQSLAEFMVWVPMWIVTIHAACICFCCKCAHRLHKTRIKARQIATWLSSRVAQTGWRPAGERHPSAQ